jgi:glycosyltransferase involved in cell wall biosynthesis
MSKPFFSVIVPLHNAEKYMRKALDSVRDQDFTDYELIIVCDACADDSEKIAHEYSDLVLNVNYGRAGLSRNAALDIATGEWILFLDDDDYYLPGAFRKIADAVTRAPDIDMLAYGFEWKGVGAVKQNLEQVFIAVWNKAWKRSFIGDDRFPDWIHSDDLGFAKKMHPRAKFGFLDEPLYYYNFMRPGSVSDKIKAGEYDNSQFPEEILADVKGYEDWLKKLF